jgi:hypothetical protein
VCTFEIATLVGRVKLMQLMGGKEHPDCYQSCAAQSFLKISPAAVEIYEIVLGVQHQCAEWHVAH